MIYSLWIKWKTRTTGWYLDLFQASKEIRRSEDAEEVASKIAREAAADDIESHAKDMSNEEEVPGQVMSADSAGGKLGQTSAVYKYFHETGTYMTPANLPGTLMQCTILPERVGGATTLHICGSTHPMWKEKYIE